MPRKQKYTSPEMGKVAKDYSMNKKQQEARYRCIEKLGNKCSLCGFDIALALEVIPPKGYANKSWISKVKDVKFAPEKFQLVCANCNAIRKSATLKQGLDATAKLLFEDTMKQAARNKEAEEAKREAPPAIDHVEYERQRQEILKKAMEERKKALRREQEEWEKLDSEYATVSTVENIHTTENIGTGEAHEALAADSERQ